MNGETKYNDVVSGYPTHISQNSNSDIVHDDAARVIISTAMSVLDLHPESMQELEAIRVFWLAAVAKQMSPILDKLALWENIGNFRDALEELLQTTLHAIAVSPSAVTVTPTKSIQKKRAHTWDRLKANAATCTMPHVQKTSSPVS